MKRINNTSLMWCIFFVSFEGLLGLVLVGETSHYG